MLAAVYAFQRFIDEKGNTVLWRWIGLAGLLLLAHDLWQNLKLWRVNVAAQYFPVTPVNLAIKVVSNHADAMYTNLLLLGAGISLTMCIIVLIGVFRKSA
jgi:hypothetical protein